MKIPNTILFIACAIIGFFLAHGSISANASQIVVRQSIAAPAVSTDDIVRAKVAQMTLDEKIGQMIIAGFPGNTLDAGTKKLITDYHIGGFNILGRNVKNKTPAQAKALFADMQKQAEIPLIMATDQEGAIYRFSSLKEKTPQYDIKTITKAATVGKTRATELRATGINMNFSPVLDYVTDKKSYLYKRTFATTPELTGALGAAMIGGYYSGNVVPVPKHFPGYGNILPDPHTNASILNIDQAEFDKNVISFKKVIGQYPEIPIMTAHIIVPKIDSVPATVSSKFLKDMLRDTLGAKGVIITDDIEMMSAASSGGTLNGKTEDTALAAIKAGADMVICSLSPSVEKPKLVFNRLKKAVETGELTEQRIDESVVRILKMKEGLK